MCLIASGGHTLLARRDRRTTASRCSARTLDDAAGEAFDKGARMLGLGYPGGAALERLAADGDPRRSRSPARPASAPRARRAGVRRGLDFSFAGLKTALLYALRDLSRDADARACARDLAASYQAAIVESLLARAPSGRSQRTGLDAARGRRRRGRQRRAAPSGWRSSASTLHVPAARAVHRQRGDDRQRRPLRAGRCAYPDYLALDAYATGEGPLR